jgi:hypothetical protein
MITKFRVKVRDVNKSTSSCLFWKVTVHRHYKKASIRSYSHMCLFVSYIRAGAKAPVALLPLGILYALFSRSSHCRRQMSPQPTRRERSERREGELLMGDKEYPIILPKCRIPRNI